jgi:hypothetical protein
MEYPSPRLFFTKLMQVDSPNVILRQVLGQVASHPFHDRIHAALMHCQAACRAYRIEVTAKRQTKAGCTEK